MNIGRQLGRGVVLIAALALVTASCGGGEPEAIELTPDQIFALQTACFDAGLFFDANGSCYADAALTERVATPAPGATTSSTSTTAATTGDTKPPPVAPTTQAPSGTTPPATSPPATSAPTTKAPTTTTTPQPPPTIGNSEWILRLTTNAPGGLDQPIALAFAVNAGDVFGSNYDPYLEKTCTTDGFIAGNGGADLFTDCQNKGVFTFFGVLSGSDFIEGEYIHENGGIATEGQFTMERN